MLFHKLLLILIVKFQQYCGIEIDLGHGINGNDGTMPDGRPMLPDRQCNEGSLRSNWTHVLHGTRSLKACLRTPKSGPLQYSCYEKLLVVLAAKRCQIFKAGGGKIHVLRAERGERSEFSVV